MTLQDKYVVKQIHGRNGENDDDWNREKTKREKIILNEAEMLIYARERDVSFVVQIQDIVRIDGCCALVMENGGEK